MGPPTGINIRNISWHGFLSIQQCPIGYIYLILIFINSVSKRIEPFCDSFNPRALLSQLVQNDVSMNAWKTWISSTRIQDFDLASVQICILDQSCFIPHNHQDSVAYGLRCYKEQQYHLCCLSLLPALEHGIRRLYVALNQLPAGLACANSEILYTTLDVFLSKSIPAEYLQQESDRITNKLPSYLGDGLCLLLGDLMMYPDGPRLRDRVAHGEVEDGAVHECYASALIIALIALSSHLSLEKKHPVLENVRCYRSYFHPQSILFGELAMMSWEVAHDPVSDAAHGCWKAWALGIIDGIEDSDDLANPGENFEYHHAESLELLHECSRLWIISTNSCASSVYSSASRAEAQPEVKNFTTWLLSSMLLTLPQQQNPDEHLLVMTQLRKAVQALLSSWNQIRCKIKENISLLVCGKVRSNLCTVYICFYLRPKYRHHFD
eukprot:TRINITY_DN7414_c0_g1_i2.p1 TRINITY_DN7414_c0_g1~~TRINITY_DN7414_c0_g1_i2.p1  ORF type:complete len:437 (+),score=55.21 TRINITY_DN7414_c0_g1_i2:1040-2350(+)